MDKYEELTKLKDLKDKKVITEEEFETQKQKILQDTSVVEEKVEEKVESTVNTETKTATPLDAKSKKAMAGFILAMCSIVLWAIPLVGFVVAVLGIVFSALGLKSDRRPFAIAGLSVSIVFLVFSLNFIWTLLFGVAELFYWL